MESEDVQGAKGDPAAGPGLTGTAKGKRKLERSGDDESGAKKASVSVEEGKSSAAATSGASSGAQEDSSSMAVLEDLFDGKFVPQPGAPEEKIYKKLKKTTDPAGRARFRTRTMLSRAYKDDDIDVAMRLYQEARAAAHGIESEMYNLILSMMSAHNRFEMVHDLHQDMKAAGLPKTEAAYASLMRCLAAAGRPEEAEALLDEMISRGIRTKIRSYEPLLLSYCRLAKASQAWSMYERMTADGLEPTEAEFAALIRLCTASNDGERLAKVVLPGMQEFLLELSADTLDALEECFRQTGALVTRPAEVMHETGLCKACGDTLSSVDLTPEATKALMDKLDAIVREDPKRVLRWDEFLRNLQSREFDVIIDGANVGFYNASHRQSENGEHTHVDYDQIAWVTEHLQEQGYKPLLVLQYRHIRYEWAPEEYHALISKWMSEKVLLVAPLKSNDDWYWMYAALAKGGKVAVITNDEMRDHTFQMLAERDFMRWKDRHLARFYMEGMLPNKRRRKINITWPTCYSRCIQQTPSGWHFPQADSETRAWLCVRTIATGKQDNGDRKDSEGEAVGDKG